MPKEYPPEVHDRAVRMALDRLDQYGSIGPTAKALAPLLALGPETPRKWVLQAQIDAGELEALFANLWRESLR